MDQTIGFVILRHVNSEETNKYWQLCYKCIRNYYPESMILIVDDNSSCEYLSNINLYKTIIVFSEYAGRGELLPYIYYLKYKISDAAVFIHDSVFINSFIDFKVDNFKFMWEFESSCVPSNPDLEPIMIKAFNDKELLDFYENKSLWKGCFGGMSVITHNYLTFINDKYNLSLLINLILNRQDREAFERVIACLLQKNFCKNTIFGNIHSYCHWGIKFNEKNNWQHLPVIKVWTGR
jgi:hypothetical protein